jgi:hypothetical protein
MDTYDIKCAAKGGKMTKRDYWITCKVETGMTSGEFSVELKTSEGKDVSLFAPKDYVDKKNGLLRVNILENSPNSCLVYLPVEPFEIGSRFINVPKDTVK